MANPLQRCFLASPKGVQRDTAFVRTGATHQMNHPTSQSRDHQTFKSKRTKFLSNEEFILKRRDAEIAEGRACELFTRHTFLGYLETQTKIQSRVDTVRERSQRDTGFIRMGGCKWNLDFLFRIGNSWIGSSDGVSRRLLRPRR